MAKEIEIEKKKESSLAKFIKASRDKTDSIEGRRNIGIFLGVFAVIFGLFFALSLSGLFSPFGITIEFVDEYIGYAKFDFTYYNYTTELEGDDLVLEPLNCRVAFVDYYTEEVINSSVLIDRDEVYYFSNVTICYIYGFVGFSDGFFTNISFPIRCEKDIDNPYINNNILTEHGRSDNINIDLYAIDDDLTPEFSQFTTDDTFAVTLNINTTGNVSYGIQTYIPEDFRPIEEFDHSSFWLEVDCNITGVTFYSGDYIYDAVIVYYDGKSYFDLAGYLFNNDIQLTFFLELGDEVPTEFNIYNGNPISDDLVATLS